MEFARLGEIRSILPPHTCVMALTATASVQLRVSIMKTLGMNNTAVTAVSPDKQNIKYSVVPFSSVKNSLPHLLKRLDIEKTDVGQQIIFCPTLDICATLHLLFRKELGSHFLFPEDAPGLSKYRLVDMFTSCIEGAETDIEVIYFSMFSPSSRHSNYSVCILTSLV